MPLTINVGLSRKASKDYQSAGKSDPKTPWSDTPFSSQDLLRG